MKIGTRSLLYGVHAFWLHPFFVAWSWYRLYGARQLRDPRMWLAFIVHDWGYWGKPNMDGLEGESHPELGAEILWWFTGDPAWTTFCAFHSRFWARKFGAYPSPLCLADKLAFTLTPAWIYVPMARATGEIVEYRLAAEDGKYGECPPHPLASDYEWFEWAKALAIKYVTDASNGNPVLPLPLGRV